MRVVLLTLFISVLTTAVSSAAAECYGDAAAMYGCAPAQGAQAAPGSGGNLERFGGSEGRVLPDTRYNDPQGGTSSDVITPQERQRMLRSIVLGGRSTYSQRSHIQAVNSAARPIRRSGTVTQGGQGR